MATIFGKLNLLVYLATKRVWAKAFSLCVGGGFQRFGVRSVISPPIRLHGTESIAIGSGVFIGSNSWLVVVGAHLKNRCAINIGNGVSISGDCVISAAENIVIEEKVLIGRYVHISDHRHSFEGVHEPIIAQGITNIAPVCIKSGAWLGQGVVVCPGVTIGKNSVIGANSIVRENVPDRCVAAGAPARIIRHLA